MIQFSVFAVVGLNRSRYVGIFAVVALGCCGVRQVPAQDPFASIVGARQISERLTVFPVDRDVSYAIDGKQRWLGAGFQ